MQQTHGNQAVMRMLQAANRLQRAPGDSDDESEEGTEDNPIDLTDEEPKRKRVIRGATGGTPSSAPTPGPDLKRPRSATPSSTPAVPFTPTGLGSLPAPSPVSHTSTPLSTPRPAFPMPYPKPPSSPSTPVTKSGAPVPYTPLSYPKPPSSPSTPVTKSSAPVPYTPSPYMPSTPVTKSGAPAPYTPSPYPKPPPYSTSTPAPFGTSSTPSPSLITSKYHTPSVAKPAPEFDTSQPLLKSEYETKNWLEVIGDITVNGEFLTKQKSGATKVNYKERVTAASGAIGEAIQQILKQDMGVSDKVNVHAEDELLLLLVQNAEHLFKSDEINEVIIRLSASPCKDCRKKIVDFNKTIQDTYAIKLIIHYHRIYENKRTSDSTQAPLLSSLGTDHGIEHHHYKNLDDIPKST
jgi:hypothetical protein